MRAVAQLQRTRALLVVVVLLLHHHRPNFYLITLGHPTRRCRRKTMQRRGLRAGYIAAGLYLCS